MELNDGIHSIDQFNPKNYSYSEVYASTDSELKVNGINLFLTKGMVFSINVNKLELIYGKVFLLFKKQRDLNKVVNKPKLIQSSRMLFTNSDVVEDNDNLLNYDDEGFIDIGYDTILTI